MGSISRLILRLSPVLLGCSLAQAFSLIGPFEAWQVADLGYDPGLSNYAPEGDVGAPKNIGQEYRVNQPFITYGFDQSFFEYFGVAGVQAVDSAIKVFNDLTPVSKFTGNLTEFPKATARVNFTAQRLSLLDVKSITMGLILEQLGLTAPERYVWTIRQRNEDTGFQMFNVVNRNFDPITFRATPYVNDSLYTYWVRPFVRSGVVIYWDAQEISLDASEPNVSVAAYPGINIGTIDGRVGRQLGFTSYGTYFSGLTRDDAGGLRYLYRPENRNVEVLPANVFPVTATGVDVIGTGSGSGGTGNWSPFTGSGFANGNTNGGGATVTAINIGVRGGLDKLQFLKVEMDPLLNQFVRPLVVRYTETVSTNGITRTQRVERQLLRPDIVFAAADLGTWAAPFVPLPWVYTRQVSHVNLSIINGISTTVIDSAGPGIVDYSAPVDIGFNRIAPGLINLGSGTTEQTALTTFVWGSYNGSTNAPVVFPAGRVNLRDLERLALGGN